MTNRVSNNHEAQTRVATFAPGELVIRAGDPGDAFYVIVRGRAGVAGKELSRTLREGDYFGEIAMVDGGPRSATVIALDELHTIAIQRRTFLGLLEADVELARTIMASLARRVRTLERRPSTAAPASHSWPIPGLA